jgi:hypothetical protein
MRIYLHIGLEKTGSSSLQSFFSSNEALLKNNNILYPSTLGDQGHVKITAFALRPGGDDILHALQGIKDASSLKDFRISVSKNLSDEIEMRSPTTLILSNEHCSSRLVTHTEIEAVQTLLSKLSSDIKIVIYLRRQDEFLVSSYSTAIKSGHAYRINNPSQAEMAVRYDYYNIIEKWSSVFGKENIIARVYEKKSSYNVIEDFMENILKISVPLEVNQRIFINKSLDIKSIELLRRLNFYLPLYEAGYLTPFRDNIGDLVERISGSYPPYYGNRHQNAEFMSYFYNGNREIAKYYVGLVHDLGDPLFGEPKITAETCTTTNELGVDEIIEMFSRVWKEKVAETAHLRLMLEQHKAIS